MIAQHWAGLARAPSGHEKAMARLADIGATMPTFTIDPADIELGRDWCRRMAHDYDLTVTPALVLLAILCGYTGVAASARALDLTKQTIKNHRTDIYRALGVVNIEGAVGLTWPAYAALRGAAIARYRATLTKAAA